MRDALIVIGVALLAWLLYWGIARGHAALRRYRFARTYRARLSAEFTRQLDFVQGRLFAPLEQEISKMVPELGLGRFMGGQDESHR